MAQESRGRFLGLPYNWSKPSVSGLRRSMWDSEDPRVLRPKAFGWGLGVNLAAVWTRLRH